MCASMAPMSIDGSWPMAACCEVDGASCAGADGLGSDEQPAATAASQHEERKDKQ